MEHCNGASSVHSHFPKILHEKSFILSRISAFQRVGLASKKILQFQLLPKRIQVFTSSRAKLKQQYSPKSSPSDQSSYMQKDSAMFFLDINFRGLQMFPSADDHEIRTVPLFEDSELLDETVVSWKRIKKSDHNLPCFRRELFTGCKKISGSVEDVDLELRLG